MKSGRQTSQWVQQKGSLQAKSTENPTFLADSWKEKYSVTAAHHSRNLTEFLALLKKIATTKKLNTSKSIFELKFSIPFKEVNTTTIP